MIINLEKNNLESLEYAANEVIKVINEGGIVVSPTDTVYGMLADAFNTDAVNRIYSIKEREKNKPLLILSKNLESVKKFSNKEVPEIIKKNIPGELTFIMPLLDELKNQFSYLKDTVALRIPNDKYMQLILKGTNPLVAPSANPSGYGIILDGNELAGLYKDKADLIINAGILENKMPSTLYDCLENKVLRQGYVHL
ncbi:L-threonylcarbamoyladenylate synthase [Brachyspira hampsonii]|uniref:L-threonylcarbamoyladenylate synthase n=1 Tax=Brachyspira hampsonii TaxID=1287055 RepID=A0AAC9TT87_9SPIR|nr:L-threonylcarbamoyladenylate synthase [Brachyspira hampsonii]ASJ21421.1 threonylcarbamoyl-AMP synthase [Brachyspira hampsonii]ELV05370.1 Sua5/YciO/YrdC/YwlC family protein [Brachyspira hampsonii 30599]MBW5379378.1 threonylcarbamoyl-AMP synthase [Brachyspira hampsonii]MBW5408786.1 threonylcarbamoyl-AMP synthase [Brachyspira hampsonii]OEJ19678.1 threonylcarbamoyl-AMP synthase [Brachyspira hampsonii]